MLSYDVYCLSHGSPNSDGKGPHWLLQAGSRAARGQITVSGLPNRLNYFVIFIVHKQFTNMAAGCRPMI